jgi:hypothetical protein
MMEAARTSETLINFYQTTRRYNPEDSHLRIHRRENLKYYLKQFYFSYPHVNYSEVSLGGGSQLSMTLMTMILPFGQIMSHKKLASSE